MITRIYPINKKCIIMSYLSHQYINLNGLGLIGNPIIFSESETYKDNIILKLGDMYMYHNNFKIKYSRIFKDKLMYCSFKIKMNYFNNNSIAIQSYNYPDHYLYNKNGQLIIKKYNDSDNYSDLASWVINNIDSCIIYDDIFKYSNLQVILSKTYDENTDIYNIFDHYLIYNKGIDVIGLKTTRIPNIGRDMHTFLYHIVHNYNNLYDTNLFISLSDKHVTGNINDYINYKNHYYSSKNKYSINTQNMKINKNGEIIYGNKIKYLQLLTFSRDILKIKKPQILYYSDTKIYYIKKNIIHKYPINYYLNLLNLFKRYNIENYLYYCWDSIFV